MNTYTWKIRGFALEDREDQPKFVKTIFYTLVVTDPTGEYSRELHSEVYLGAGLLESFTPFESLAESTVVEWIKNCFTVTDYAIMLSGLDTMLAEYIVEATRPAETIVTELPWGGVGVLSPSVMGVIDYAAYAVDEENTDSIV